MKNLQRGFIVPLLLLVMALVVTGGFYFYAKDKQSAEQVTVGNIGNAGTPTSADSTASEQNCVVPESESIFTGGGDYTSCLSDPKNPCKVIQITPRIELSQSVKNSTYLIDEVGGGFCHPNSLVVSIPTTSMRFLEPQQHLIVRSLFKNLIPNTELDSTIPTQSFNTYCSSTTLPVVTSRPCYWAEANSYLFNSNGKRLVSGSDFASHYIYTHDYDKSDWSNVHFNSLETVKRMRLNDPAVFSTFPESYISASSTLESIVVVYDGTIEGESLVAGSKIEEISYFKDGSQTSIKF